MKAPAITELQAQMRALMNHAFAAIEAAYKPGTYSSQRAAHPEFADKVDRTHKFLTLAAHGLLRGTTTLDKYRQRVEAWRAAEVILWTA